MTVIGGQSSPVEAAEAVAAEWALWGKEARDTEYRLLRCSDGTFGSRDFTFVLDRYSPGTLDELPQVTVSWIRHPQTGEPSHLAVAIHETAAGDDPHSAAARSRYDAAGREITFVRYFCVSYETLARQAISYESMYTAFQRRALPELGRGPVRVDMRALPRQQPAGQVRQLADLVAAQLLTSQPVCILGAGQLAVIERLRFIDLVMSQLPYGTRSCLSAATWVNSNFAEHKLRLFFAAAPRQRGGLGEYADGRRKPDDIVVQWGRPDSIRVADPIAEQYLNWPGRARSWAATALAHRTARVDLQNSRAIREMVRALPLGPVGELAVPETLECLGEDIRKGDAYSIPLYIENLHRHCNDPSPVPERGYYRKIIKYYDLLGANPPSPPSPPNPRDLRDQLYDVLLRLAFDGPLTYEGYLQVEDCIGMPLRKHPALLAALSRAESADTDISWILVQRGLGRDDNALLSELWYRRVMAAAPAFQLAADVARAQPRIRPEHGRQVFDTALQYMLRYGTDRRAAFKELGYLAPVLDHYYPADQPAQVSRLVQILHNTHGNRLGKGDIREILGASAYPPTDALLGAVISLAPRQADFAKITYGTARTAGFVATRGRRRRSAPGWLARAAQHPKSIAAAVGLSVIAAMMILSYVLLGVIHR